MDYSLFQSVYLGIVSMEKKQINRSNPSFCACEGCPEKDGMPALAQ